MAKHPAVGVPVFFRKPQMWIPKEMDEIWWTPHQQKLLIHDFGIPLRLDRTSICRGSPHCHPALDTEGSPKKLVGLFWTCQALRARHSVPAGAGAALRSLGAFPAHLATCGPRIAECGSSGLVMGSESNRTLWGSVTYCRWNSPIPTKWKWLEIWNQPAPFFVGLDLCRMSWFITSAGLCEFLAQFHHWNPVSSAVARAICWSKYFQSWSKLMDQPSSRFLNFTFITHRNTIWNNSETTTSTKPIKTRQNQGTPHKIKEKHDLKRTEPTDFLGPHGSIGSCSHLSMISGPGCSSTSASAGRRSSLGPQYIQVLSNSIPTVPHIMLQSKVYTIWYTLDIVIQW